MVTVNRVVVARPPRSTIFPGIGKAPHWTICMCLRNPQYVAVSRCSCMDGNHCTDYTHYLAWICSNICRQSFSVWHTVTSVQTEAHRDNFTLVLVKHLCTEWSLFRSLSAIHKSHCILTQTRSRSQLFGFLFSSPIRPHLSHNNEGDTDTGDTVNITEQKASFWMLHCDLADLQICHFLICHSYGPLC